MNINETVLGNNLGMRNKVHSAEAIKIVKLYFITSRQGKNKNKLYVRQNKFDENSLRFCLYLQQADKLLHLVLGIWPSPVF